METREGEKDTKGFTNKTRLSLRTPRTSLGKKHSIVVQE